MSLINSFFCLTWRRKNTLLGLVIVTASLGVFARLGYQQFLYLQAQNISGLSVFNEILLPLAGLTIVCQFIMSLLVSVQLIPNFHLSGQGSLLQQASIKPSKLLISVVLPLFVFALYPLVNFVLISLFLSLFSTVDLIRLALTVLGLLMINWILSLIILIVCFRAKNTLVAIIQSLLSVSLLLLIEAGLVFLKNNTLNDSVWQGIFQPFLSLREGELIYADIINYFGWLLFLISLLYLVLSRQLSRNKFVAKVILFTGLIILFLAGFIPGQLDLSVDKRSSLSQSLKNQLNTIKDDLQITAVIDELTSRDEILRGYNIIKTVSPNTKIIFQSRQSLQPELKHTGEYINFKIGNLQQAVAYPFEQDVKHVFESAISQMLQKKQQWITFIEGHDEASPFAVKTSDLGGFYQALKAGGWPVAAQNLITMPIISDNTGLLVIASSKKQWMNSEINAVLNYLNNGGHLLILADPDCLIPDAIENFIGITRYSGTLVDWNSYQNGTPHPAVVIVNTQKLKQNIAHPVLSNINSLLAFPWASGLKLMDVKPLPEIKYETIIDTHRSVWNELDIGAEQLSFNQTKGELQQSFMLAISRYNSSNKQKIVMVGDSHFASDSAINNYSNKQFALNLVSWLTNSVAEVDGNSASRDNSIKPNNFGHFGMNWLFSIIFPIFTLMLWLVSQRLRTQAYKK